MIQVQNLRKFYGETEVLKNISFTVKQGEIIGFLGPNGAGKSTTMRIITGFIAANSGDVKVDGHSIREEPEKVKSLIGYLPERPPLYKDHTVRGFLRFVSALKGIDKAEVDKTIQWVTEKTGTEEVIDRIIGHLSKGFQQRVGLASALLGKPPVLILDEPTVGLDAKQIRSIRTLIRELSSSHTIILSSHILPEVSELCQKIIIIHQGNIVAQDKKENLGEAAFRDKQFTLILDSPPNQTALEEIKSASGADSFSVDENKVVFSYSTGKDPRQAILKNAVEKGLPVLEARLKEASLEEIFVHLTTEEKS